MSTGATLSFETKGEELVHRSWHEGHREPATHLPNGEKVVRGKFLSDLMRSTPVRAGDEPFWLGAFLVTYGVDLDSVAFSRPLHFEGTRFTGPLSLRGSTMPALRMQGICELEHGLDLSGLQVEGELAMLGTLITQPPIQEHHDVYEEDVFALTADGLQAESWLIAGGKIEGCFRAPDAAIGHLFRMHDVRVHSVCNKLSLDWSGLRAGSLDLWGCKVEGGCTIERGLIDRQVTIKQCAFPAHRGGGVGLDATRLRAEGLTVAGGGGIEGLKLDGVVLRGDAALADAKLVLPKAEAVHLSARGARMEGVLDLPPIESLRVDLQDLIADRLVVPRELRPRSVDLRRARLGSLRDQAANWSGIWHLSGLTYYHLDNPLGSENRDTGPSLGWRQFVPGTRARRRRRDDAKHRIAWLESQPPQRLTERFDPQPWRQLAATLSRQGYDEDARLVTVERRTAFRRSSACKSVQTGVLAVLEATGRYGFAPGRTVLWSAGVVAVFSLLFAFMAAGCAMPGDCLDGTIFLPVRAGDIAVAVQSGIDGYVMEGDVPAAFYPAFSSILFSLDTFVPIIEFGHTESWAVNNQGTGRGVLTGAVLQWLVVAERVLGAFLTAYAVVGFSGLLARDEGTA